jgi:FlaG/FlaF family flagellin (archaellin)
MSTYDLTMSEKIIAGNTWDGHDFTINTIGVDYTGATVMATIRSAPGELLLLDKSITPSTAESGLIVFTFSLTATETRKLRGNKAECDILIKVGAREYTPIYIKFNITQPLHK